MKHRLLPETATSHDARECVYKCQDDDSLHRARDYAESEGLRVVFVPGLYVEGEERYIPLVRSRGVPVGKQTSKERHNRFPTHSQVLRGCENQDFQRGVERIDAMIKQLSQRTTLMCSPPILQSAQISLPI